jgi:hypothetical protein
MSLLDRDNYDKDEHWYTNGVRIAWWDRSIKSWTSYLIDSQGHQRTPAEYFANRTQFEEIEANGWLDKRDDEKTLRKAILNDQWG